MNTRVISRYYTAAKYVYARLSSAGTRREIMYEELREQAEDTYLEDDEEFDRQLKEAMGG